MSQRDVTEMSDEELLAMLRIDDKPTGVTPPPPGRKVKWAPSSGRKAAFVQLPTELAERLRGISPTWDLLVAVLTERWRSGNETVVASNTLANRAGVSPSSKSRALAQLEERGAAKVERGVKRSPRVTILLLPPGPEVTPETTAVIDDIAPEEATAVPIVVDEPPAAAAVPRFVARVCGGVAVKSSYRPA